MNSSNVVLERDKEGPLFLSGWHEYKYIFLYDLFFVFLTRMAKMHNSEPLNSTLFRQNKKHMKFEFDKLDCIGFPRMVWAHT